jgi:hypothetical protein
MVGKGLFPIMPLHLFQRMQDFTFYMNKPMFFYRLLFSLQVDGSTLWFQWMVFGCWLT